MEQIKTKLILGKTLVAKFDRLNNFTTFGQNFMKQIKTKLTMGKTLVAKFSLY